ncbi:MAG: hypothetical protein J5983_07295 [Ruminococcus sp.]|nr:hypothetical protein [Ruminococcus sp.]
MKKLRIIGIIVFIFVLMSTTVLASDPQLNVWIDKEKINIQDSMLEIESDGTTTDGLIVLTYDPVQIKFTDEDVRPGSGIEMYSAHVVEEGTLKIAYLAEETIPEGILFTISFDAETEVISDAITSLEGEIHDINGDILQIGILSPEDNQTEDENEDSKNEDSKNEENVAPGEEADKSEDNNGSPSNDSSVDGGSGSGVSDKDNKNSLSTGDGNSVLFYSVLCISAAVIAVLILKKRNRQEDK